MSSSGSRSWCGGNGGPTDIIDLDKFMRGSVRPSRHVPSIGDITCDRLIVDNGGPSLKMNTHPSSSEASTRVCAPRVKHQKRFSHDSGLSDGSYNRRRHRPHRRISGSEGTVRRHPRDIASARTHNTSSNSLRAFRAVCERALLDQQQQIARVAQLCERLTEQKFEKYAERVPERERGEPSATAESSELSSSSRSTRDPRRKDKHRAQECKTYKIIMNKLDDLNRLFAVRGCTPPVRSAPLARRASFTSGSVTVSDKFVATEPEVKKPATKVATSVQPPRVIDPPAPQLVERAVGGTSGSVQGSAMGSQRVVAAPCAVTQAFSFDISPREALTALQKIDHPNVATESIVKCDSSDESRFSKYDPRCGFDLNDPMHLYSQAKRLQALHASTRRSHNTDGLNKLNEVNNKRERERSLCALCRCYWRSLRHFVAAQFCCPEHYKYS